MNIEIYNISVDDIEPHPKQDFHYGLNDPPQKFIDSIRDHGVLQAGIVTPSKTPGKFTLIAGFQRWRASVICGYDTLPVAIRHYENDDDAYEEFLVLNMYREKTREEKAREIEAMQILLSKKGKLKQSQAGKARLKNEKESFSGNPEKHFEELEISRSELVDTISSEPLNSAKIIAEKLGVSKTFVEQNQVVCNADYRDKYFNKLRKLAGVDKNIEDKIEKTFDTWENISKDYFTEKISLDAAYKQVLALKDKAMKPYEKIVKADKPDAPKKEKTSGVSFPIIYQSSKAKCKFSEKPITFNPDNAVFHFLFKDGGMSFGVVEGPGGVCGLCADTPNGVAMLDTKAIAGLILKSLSKLKE